MQQLKLRRFRVLEDSFQVPTILLQIGVVPLFRALQIFTATRPAWFLALQPKLDELSPPPTPKALNPFPPFP